MDSENWILKKIFLRYYEGTDKQDIITKYSKPEWEKVISYINESYPRAKISTTAIKLSNKLKEEFDIDVFPVIRRTNAGHWQRSAGAWTWYMYDINLGTVGSQFRASECALKKTKLYASGSYLETHIDID